MASKAEQVIAALLARLETIETPRRAVKRDDAVPERIPPDGLVVLRSGDPGPPDELLGGAGPYVYGHAVEIDLVVQAGDPFRRAAEMDALAVAVGGALDADPTLGGLAHGMTYGAPARNPERVEGAADLDVATIELTVEYQSETRI